PSFPQAARWSPRREPSWISCKNDWGDPRGSGSVLRDEHRPFESPSLAQTVPRTAPPAAVRLFSGANSVAHSLPPWPGVTGNQLPLALLSSCLVFACGSAEPADEADAYVSSDGVGTSNATGAGGAASSTASTGTAHTATSTTT